MVEIGPNSTSFCYTKWKKSVGVDREEIKRQFLERAEIYSKIAAAHRRVARSPWWYALPKTGSEPTLLRFSAPTARP